MIKRLKLKDITVNGGTDVRHEINDSVVDEYGEAAKAGAEFPPLIVFKVGKEYLLADGFHRIYGFERFGIKEWECDIREGTREDALKFALGCNTEHGYRRTNLDKQNAVKIALKEWPALSDRLIAEICHVSHPMVAPIRKSSAPPPRPPATVKGQPSNPPIQPSNTAPAATTAQSTPPPRKGKDGKTYKTKTPPAKPKTVDATNHPVPDEIIAHWDASLTESTRLLTLVSETRSRLKVAQDRREPMFRRLNINDAIGKLDLVYAEIKLAKPYAVCPECQGVETHKGEIATENTRCGSCQGNGWVSQFYWDTCVPEEIKKASGRE